MTMLRRFGAWLDAPVHLLLFLCSLIPIALVILDVSQNSTQTPLLDDWHNGAIIAVRTADGALSPADIFRQYYEHRLVFPNLITAISAGAAGWNLQIAVVITLIVVAVSFGLLVALFVSVGPDDLGVALALIPFALLLFTLRQRDIWLLSGHLMGYPLAVMFLLGGLWYVRRAPVTLINAVGAAIWAVCMSLSVLQGFLGWLVIGAYMLIRGYRRPEQIGAFAGIGVITLILYLIGFDFSVLGTNSAGQPLGLATNLNSIVGYVFTFLGSPLVTIHDTNIALATFAALVGIVLTIWNSLALFRAGKLEQAALWLLLIAFAVGTAIVTALGNAHVFPDPIPTQPMTGRYTPFASLFWVGVVALGLLNLRRWQTRPEALAAQAEAEAVAAAEAVELSTLDPSDAPPTEAEIEVAAAEIVAAVPLASPTETEAEAEAETDPAVPAPPRDPDHGLGRLIAANVVVFIAALGLYLFVVRMQPAFAPPARASVTECLLDFPRSRNLGCMVGIVYPRLDTGAFTQLISRVAIHELAAFRGAPIPYTDVIELSRLGRSATVARADGAPPRFDTFDYGGGIVGNTLIMEATTQIDFQITIPTTPAPVVFRSAGIIDTRQIPADVPLDGVTFRVAVAQANLDPVILLEVPFDPTTTRAFALLEADLSPYRGQTIRLIVQATGGEISVDNIALWLDPIIEVRSLAGTSAP